MHLTLVPRTGSTSWYIRGTDPNTKRPIFESTKTSDRKTAEALLVKAENKLLVERVHGKVATTTFGEAAMAYIAAGGQKTYLFRERRGKPDTGLLPHFGYDRLLSTITQRDLENAAAKLCEPGASRETLIRNVYTPFIAVWNYASSASRNWAVPKKWERPRKQKGTAVRRATIRSGTSPVAYERAWQFVSVMSPAPAMVMTALFYTGMRPIELFTLSCDDINVDGRWITVQSSKTGESRGVPMHEVLVPLLTALKERGAATAFLNRHGEAYPPTDDEHKGQLSSAINGARKRLLSMGTPIDDVSPYTARHTVSTQLVIAGVHPHVKDQILGHAVDDMSRHYTHVPQAPLIEAINKLPTIEAWASAEWILDPIGFQPKLYSPVTGGKRPEIIRLFGEGKDMVEIAALTGVGKSSVFAVLRSAGLTGTNAAAGTWRGIGSFPAKKEAA